MPPDDVIDPEMLAYRADVERKAAKEEPSAALVNPATGELLPATPENAAMLLEKIREAKSLLNQAADQATAVLIEEASRQGTRTLHIDGETWELSAGYEIDWDLTTLSELVRANLPRDRWEELTPTTITTRVNAAVAKQLEAANPAYAEIIGRARRKVPAKQYARRKAS